MSRRARVCAVAAALSSALCAAAASAPPPLPAPAVVACAVSADGSFALTVDGAPFLASAPTFTRADGRLLSTADGSLSVAAPPAAPVAGSDNIGAFNRTEVVWLSSAGGAEAFRTAVQVYAAEGVVVFEQSWPSGAAGTAAPGDGAADTVLSGWPSFALDAADKRGAVSFGGRFLEASRAVALADAARNGMPSVGQHGGPLVVFDAAFGAAVALVSLTQHAVMVSAVTDGAAKGDSALSYGVIGSVTSIPPGFVARTLVAATRGGPSAGMLRAGRAALRYHGTVRAGDNSTKVLGYGTDNGAYFYYKTEINRTDGKPLTYEQTLLDVMADARARDIPYQYVQLDSWWYTQGKGGGVVSWTAKPDVFPHGLAWLHEQLGVPFFMHNRMWSSETTYAAQNGGTYSFTVETANSLAIPLEQVFWDDLLANNTPYISVYEQDWMYNEVEGLNATRESATLTGQWLTQMATAAAKVGAGIQYCMTLGRLLTMAVELPQLTQFRAGDDYGPGQTATCSFPYCVYYIGTTSLLGWALDVAPSKDGFWSAEVQPGSPFGRGNATEPYAAMEAAIAVLSTANVMIDDGLDPSGRSFTNATLVLATCTSGGRLLQPSRPASAIDACFATAAFQNGGPAAQRDGNLPVMSTHTFVSGHRWAHVLVVGLANAATLGPADLPLDLLDADAAGGFVAYRGWSERGGGSFEVLGAFSAASPLALAAAPDPHDWSLTHVAPVFANKWALLGEAAKIVPVSVLRAASVAATAAGVQVGLAGEAGERVELMFLDPSGAVVAAACTLPASGMATLTVDASGGACA